LLFLDEIQTGIGRTGKLFAYEWAGIKPDIVASAKGLGGGFPIGACLATAHGASGMLAGMHGSTFGGNPLACAVASAVLEEILQPEFLPQVDKVARVLWHKLVDFIPASNGVFTAVRGAGLLLGLQCRDNNIDVAKALLKKGLLVVPAWDNVIRLLPPLIITEQHIDEALAILTAYKDNPNA
jgi:acetylornithine/N-succinyldiaminopimelate aminotransferase